jgi:predicted PurR-regulated permease PerM
MELNPLLVFLALILGIWLWGPLGGIVAIPVVLWLLVMAGVLPRQIPGTMEEKTTTPGQHAE